MIERDKLNEDRLNRLTEALDFFSQMLSVEQLSNYGLTFLRHILSLEDAGLFMKTADGSYEMVNYQGDGAPSAHYMDDGRLNALATLLGRALWKDFDQYFKNEFVAEWQMQLVVPIILQDKLIGFILSKGIDPASKAVVDVAFVESIKNAMNMAFYMAVNYEESKFLEKEIDRRVFNLFFVNQSTKVLLSELNLDNLYQLCIDVVRELTSSSKTAFCLYDEIRDRVIVKGYNDILTFTKQYTEFHMKSRKPISSRMVYHLRDSEQKSELEMLISNTDDLEKLGAEYIILLVKDEIIGFVTVGQPVNDVAYDESILSQIESLASSIYISITNATFIREIQSHRKTIEQQLKTINGLNRMIKNINSCQSVDEIAEITLSTLEVGYGVRKAFVAARTIEGTYRVLREVGMPELNGQTFAGTDLGEQCQSQFFYDYDTRDLEQLLPAQVIEKLKSDLDVDRATSVVVSPIKLDVLEFNGCGVVGYVVILESEQMLKQEDFYGIEVMSNCIAPVFRHMLIQEELRLRYIPDARILFFDELMAYHRDKEEYLIDYRVYYKKLNLAPFERPKLQDYSMYRHFVFDGYVYVLVRQEDWVNEDHFDGFMEDALVKELLNGCVESFVTA